MKFITKNSAHSAIHIVYRERNEERVYTKFLGLQIENHRKWKNHIEEMMPKWSMLCH